MQVFVTGSQVVGKAFMEAYRQASSASLRASATAAAREKTGGVSLSEARKILGIEDGSLDLEQAQKKYDYLFDANSREKSGSFYLQSKVYRAMECVKYEVQQTEAEKATETNGKAETKGKDSS